MPLLVLEGMDGAGKSGCVPVLRACLEARGEQVVCLREPGGTVFGEKLRTVLIDPASGALNAWTEACLFTAARSELVQTVIRPALARGETVLLDRWWYSTLAYQGYAGGADVEALRAMNLAATGALLPDRVLLFDLNPQTALGRIQRQHDRMEAKGVAFLQAVRDGYLREAARDPARFRVLDATLPPALLARAAVQAVL
ncbi:MAG: dTMP kinase [Planctomycetes bacterium]|nr:dTMP kinase [Planctomycetota bacterium]